jgi:hypothetical protein
VSRDETTLEAMARLGGQYAANPHLGDQVVERPCFGSAPGFEADCGADGCPGAHIYEETW